MKHRLLPFLLATALGATSAAHAGRKSAGPLPQRATSDVPDAGFLSRLASAQYRFSPEIREDYLATAEKRALAKIGAKGIALPADFLAWVDGDPVVRATVFGMRADPAPTLLWLRSLELDLGKETVRKDYTQLALAAAVQYSGAANPWPDVSSRAKPFALVIPQAKPNARVNTKDTSRPLDRDDHIVNFFLDHPKIKGEMVGGMLKELPELVYDDKGVAAGADRKTPVMVERQLIPADVMASRALQAEFNAYMKSKGFPTDIDCGDRVVYPGLRDAIKRTPQYKGIVAAYRLFKDAYEKKGLLSVRDEPATPAERLAFLIRNDRSKLPPERQWPRYPLTAPWPTLTMLAADRTPLREAEDLWRRFADKGELHTYGEYIGPIAQDFTGQSARRLAPYDYGYGSVQMKLKDGGVCGTMASICATSFSTLGIPSCPAGQPGHCALILMRRTGAGLYECSGKQFVTADESGTRPSAPLPFADIDARRPMADHECVAWAANVGEASFLNDVIAFNIFRAMPKAERAAHGDALLLDAAKANPFFFPMVEAGFSEARTRAGAAAFFDGLRAAMQANAAAAGCGDIFARHIAQLALDRIAKLPEDPASAAAVKAISDFADSVRKKTKAELRAEKAAARAVAKAAT